MNKDQQNRQHEGGSGSAEAQGRERSEQEAPISYEADTRQDIAQGAGIGQKDIADIEELGGGSGRDDASGGSGDHMEDQSSHMRTDIR